jgi:phospholipid/cholesterol/gamma-HCH transport system substrate-binding protein
VQKQPPTLGRLLVMVGFALSCFGLLLFLWLAFGGTIPFKPQGYRFNAYFNEATSLSKEADVTISGVRVGKVKTLEPDNQTGRTKVVMELEPRYAPLPADAKAILRQKTLLGETYVELTPGNRDGPKVPENGSLSVANVSPTVELDEIFRAFDEKTRNAFQVWMQSQAQAVDGRGQDLNDALGNLQPFAEDTNKLLVLLNSQEGAVSRLVRNTGVVFGALSERDGQLRSLIENSNELFRVTAKNSQQLADFFTVLPTFEKESTLTVNRLSKFAKDTNPLVTQLRPAARELSPTLEDLTDLAPDLNAFLHDVGPLADAGKKGIPALEDFTDQLRPLLAQIEPFARSLNPSLQEIGLHDRDLVAFIANAMAATQAVPAGSTGPHYLRLTNPFNSENLALYPRRIGTNRPNPYFAPRGFDKLATGLQSYETRQCGRTNPGLTPLSALDPALQAILPSDMYSIVTKYAFGGADRQVIAPPCIQQGPLPSIGSKGESTQYRHVRTDPQPAP